MSLAEVIEKAAKAIDFEEKYKRYSKPQSGDTRRGIGMAISYRGCSLGAEAVDAAGAVCRFKRMEAFTFTVVWLKTVRD